MHIVQGKRLTGEPCIIEYINTGTLDQFQHSQTQVSLNEQATTGLANQKLSVEQLHLDRGDRLSASSHGHSTWLY
jgi:hypothetical protein